MGSVFSPPASGRRPFLIWARISDSAVSTRMSMIWVAIVRQGLVGAMYVSVRVLAQSELQAALYLYRSKSN